jgi:hypothetical protein
VPAGGRCDRWESRIKHVVSWSNFVSLHSNK